MRLLAAGKGVTYVFKKTCMMNNFWCRTCASFRFRRRKVCQAEEAETDYRLRRRERFDLRGEADLISQGVKSEVIMEEKRAVITVQIRVVTFPGSLSRFSNVNPFPRVLTAPLLPLGPESQWVLVQISPFETGRLSNTLV